MFIWIGLLYQPWSLDEGLQEAAIKPGPVER